MVSWSDVDARPRRRPELDAIRTFVVVGLVFFHSALVFDANDDFYIKNPETTNVTTVLAGLGVLWAMPILFLIAGLGAYHSLRRRGPGGFAVERLLRLGVPLVVATVTIVPVPQWLRLKAADPAYDESYWRFLARFFDVHLDLSNFPFVLRGEYFETGHLWFVVLLIAFSLLLAPVVAAVGAGPARDRLAAWVERRRGATLLPAVVFAVVTAVLGMEESYAGWHRWAYLLFFLSGFLLASDDRFRAAMRRDATAAAIVGGVLFLLAGPGLLLAGDDPFTEMTPVALAARALFGAAGWCCVVAILGLLDRRRRRERPPAPWYLYLAVAALPLYVLHQPIVVTVAHFVVRWDAPMFAKYVTIAAISLAVTLAAYDLLVRRTPVTRLLFGMRATAPRPGP
jgi:peptidoglycan/LPS O-acetylase OafA/YrhL